MFGGNQKQNKLNQPILHLCAFKMRMESLLFADETPILWTFSKRKGVIKLS